MTDQDDLITKLERLQHLRDAGVLTQAELDAQKAALLGRPATAPVTCAGCGAPLQVTPDRRCVYCGFAVPAESSAGVVGGNDALADAAFAANPEKKIVAIKQLREQTGLSLKEAKDLIDAAERRSKR